MPPPAPRTCFGRDELIEKLVGYAENLEPTALIGAGGIGKTAIALTVLHDDRIKDQFGNNRRFIRCDQFPASCSHFLARLSKVIGAGIENPEDLTSLRAFFSQKMFIVIDNAESVLDPQGTDAQEIYGVMSELCQFKTICICITSRLTTVPGQCKRPEIPTLTMEAARDIFNGIYNGERSDIIDNLLRRLDFHALSITLLATTASHNMWDYEELVKEWEKHRAQVLRTDYNESLAATIELSLASPTFRKLGPDARELLGVVAFFPQGVDEKNLDSFFPTISDKANIFSRFRVLSLIHRNNGFLSMLAPIRDYLCPQDPKSSPLLCGIKDCYFGRLSVDVDPNKPGFKEAEWIKSEDVNVEHLLNVFVATDADDVWDACAHFMDHLYWHKKRLTVLGPKIKGLPDDHPFKPRCLFELSTLYESVGNFAEQKQLLSHVLKLERERENDNRVALTLWLLSDTNRMVKKYEEGIQQAKEALEIYKRLGDTVNQAGCLIILAYLLRSAEQLDAAEEAGSRALQLLPEKGKEFEVCKCHRALGNICSSKGAKEKAIHHFETALEIASTFNWRVQLFWIHESLADLFLREGDFDDAQAHIDQAKSDEVEDTYFLGRAMKLQTKLWIQQNRLEEAKSEALSAIEIFEKHGAAKHERDCRDLIQEIELAIVLNLAPHPPDSVPEIGNGLEAKVSVLQPRLEDLSVGSALEGQRITSATPVLATPIN